jgi:hypothetical protein
LLYKFIYLYIFKMFMIKNDKAYTKQAPYPIDLTDLQADLQQEGFERDWSLHKVIRKALFLHVERRKAELEKMQVIDNRNKAKSK